MNTGLSTERAVTDVPLGKSKQRPFSEARL